MEKERWFQEEVAQDAREDSTQLLCVAWRGAYLKCAHPITVDMGQQVPCGRCICCRVNRGQDWSLRLLHEEARAQYSCFVTLTYANEIKWPDVDPVELEIHPPSLVPKDLQDFLKRLRKDLGERKIKYYCVGEYGDGKGRPHYHGVFFGIGVRDRELIEKCWGWGNVQVKVLIPERINYVTSYINKKIFGDAGKVKYMNRVPPFARMSKGIGLAWLEENIDQAILHRGVFQGGRLKPLPRYYVKRIKQSIGNRVGFEYEQDMLDALYLDKLESRGHFDLSAEELKAERENERQARIQGERDLDALFKMYKRGNM